MFRYRHYLAHIVMQKRLFATVVPLNGHTRPVSFRDRASIHFVIAPANAVADFKVSRLIAGHLFTCLFPVGTYARTGRFEIPHRVHAVATRSLTHLR